MHASAPPASPSAIRKLPFSRYAVMSSTSVRSRSTKRRSTTNAALMSDTSNGTSVMIAVRIVLVMSFLRGAGAPPPARAIADASRRTARHGRRRFPWRRAHLRRELSPMCLAADRSAWPQALLLVGLHDRAPKRSAARARACAATSSRFFGDAVVVSESIRRRATSATSSMARSNAASFAFDGALNPLSLRTNCSDAARISSSVAGGSKLNSVLMFLHILYSLAGPHPRSLMPRARCALRACGRWHGRRRFLLSHGAHLTILHWRRGPIRHPAPPRRELTLTARRGSPRPRLGVPPELFVPLPGQ